MKPVEIETWNLLKPKEMLKYYGYQEGKRKVTYLIKLICMHSKSVQILEGRSKV